MHWSVEEQTIPTTVFAGDHHPHLTSISLRTDDSSSHIVVMELRVEADEEVAGYMLRFGRNGTFISSEVIPATLPEAPPPDPVVASHASVQHTASRPKR